jgi:hypothetical protein
VPALTVLVLAFLGHFPVPVSQVGTSPPLCILKATVALFIKSAHLSPNPCRSLVPCHLNLHTRLSSIFLKNTIFVISIRYGT